jgi:hypothetical protein
VIVSGHARLRYKLDSGPFTAANLQIDFKDAQQAARSWHPGDTDSLNLGGLPYSLDNISTENLPATRSDALTPINDLIPGIDVLLEEAKPGLLSRSGYAFIDDSHTPVWNSKQRWIEPRPQQSAQDWYFFAYGRDYSRDSPESSDRRSHGGDLALITQQRHTHPAHVHGSDLHACAGREVRQTLPIVSEDERVGDQWP